MIVPDFELPEILRHSPVRVAYGAGKLEELGILAREEGASCILLVTDPGIVAAGHLAHALDSLQCAGLTVKVFDGVRENPTTEHVEAGITVASRENIDFVIALGGGSSMDCAKGINLILSNGGRIADYWGINKPVKPMLPMIAVPTTAGTGSEAQSFALISDAATGEKMACGDRRAPTEGGLRPRVAILDWKLTRTQPLTVAAATGIDAIAHAVETAGSTARTDMSLEFSRQAWKLLNAAFETVITQPNPDSARANMLLGAHLAGVAIEHSMLGAAHACANPLTACYGITHGFAVGMMLPHVIRFNAAIGGNPYSTISHDAESLADRVNQLLVAGCIPQRLSAYGVAADGLPQLAALAAKQWTAAFNPRPVGQAELLKIYQMAL